MTSIGWLVFAMLLSAKALLVLAAAYGLTRLMVDRSAAERHLVWMLASACVLALPALSLAGPAWRISVPASWVEAMNRFDGADEAPAGRAVVVEATQRPSHEERHDHVTRALGTPALAPAPTPAPSASESGRRSGRRRRWPRWRPYRRRRRNRLR
jgi:hypothetical protein